IGAGLDRLRQARAAVRVGLRRVPQLVALPQLDGDARAGAAARGVEYVRGDSAHSPQFFLARCARIWCPFRASHMVARCSGASHRSIDTMPLIRLKLFLARSARIWCPLAQRTWAPDAPALRAEA